MRTLVDRFVRDFPETYSRDEPLVASVAPLASVTVAEVRPYLLTLFGAVLFVRLIACVNVANLFLARGEARRKELAIRSAIGASGRRVARQVRPTDPFVLGGVTTLVVLIALVAWFVPARRASAANPLAAIRGQ